MISVACHQWIPPSMDVGLPSMEIPTIHRWNMPLVIENHDEMYGGSDRRSFHPWMAGISMDGRDFHGWQGFPWMAGIHRWHAAYRPPHHNNRAQYSNISQRTQVHTHLLSSTGLVRHSLAVISSANHFLLSKQGSKLLWSIWERDAIYRGVRLCSGLAFSSCKIFRNPWHSHL